MLVGGWLEWIDRDATILSLSLFLSSTSKCILNAESDHVWIHPRERERIRDDISISISITPLLQTLHLFFPFSFSLPLKYTKYTRNLTSHFLLPLLPIHQIWKARLSAYTELSSLFSRSSSEQDPIFKTYTRNPDLLKSMVLDANAVAQEKATECLKAFVEFGGKAAGKWVSDTGWVS